MKKTNTVWEKFKLFWRELGNILLNIACPVLSMIAAICELLQLPASVIDAIKKAEYWCFYAFGTKKVIDKIIENAVEALEDGEMSPDEIGELGHDIKEAYEQIREDVQKK